MSQQFQTFGELHSQPNFPFVDLSETNAAITAVMVASPELTAATHVQSEGLHPVFRRTHPAIERGAERVYDEFAKMRAISYGAAVFEVIAALVSAQPDAEREAILLTTGAFAASSSRTNIMRFTWDAEDVFRSEMPLTTEVVTEAAQSGNTNPSYAVLGAALTRKLSIDAETAAGQIILER